MRLIIGIFIIIVSGGIGYLLENKFLIIDPAFYWIMGFWTAYIVLSILGKKP